MGCGFSSGSDNEDGRKNCNGKGGRIGNCGGDVSNEEKEEGAIKAAFSAGGARTAATEGSSQQCPEPNEAGASRV